MTSETSSATRILSWIGLLGLFAYAAANALTPLANNDIWIHLTTGGLILDEKVIPRFDRYSFTAAGNRYVAHEWLAALFYALGERAAGIPGVIVVAKLLPSLAIAGGLVAASRAAGVPTPLLFPLATVALTVVRYRTMARPELFALALGLLLLTALLHDRHEARKGRRTLAPYALIPLAALWANLHASFPIAIALVGVFALADWLEEWLPRRDRRASVLRAGICTAGLLCATGLSQIEPASFGVPAALFVLGLSLLFAIDARWPLFEEVARGVGQGFWRLFGIAVAMAAAAALNPLGFEIYTFPFEFTSAGSAVTQTVLEWVPLFDSGGLARSLTLPAYFFWSALWLAAIGLAAARRRLSVNELGLFCALSLLPLLHNRWMGLAALFGAPALALTLYRARLGGPIRSGLGWALAGIFLLMSLGGGLAGAAFVLQPPWDPLLGSACLLSGACAALGTAAALTRRVSLFACGAVGAVACLCLALTTALIGIPEFKDAAPRKSGLGVDRSEPVAPVAFLAAGSLGTKLLTEYHWAGYAIHALWPTVRVFIDSRSEVYPADLLREIREAKTSSEAAQLILERYGVDLVLLRYARFPGSPDAKNPGFHAALESDPEWRLELVDDRGLLYTRARRGEEAPFAHFRPRHFRLGAAENRDPRLEEEIRRALERAPGSAFLHFALAEVLRAQGRPTQAREAALRACRLGPRDAAAAVLAGELAAAAGDSQEARRWLERAARLAPRWDRPRRMLAEFG